MASAALSSRLACSSVAANRGAGRHSAVLTHARHRQRWWSDAWEDDSVPEGWGLDGPLASGGPRPSAPVEPITTFFCSDGTILQLGVRPSPRWQQTTEQRAALGSVPVPADQGLCIGSVFTINATNGLDAARRVNLSGFCFSAEQLYEQVEDTVLARGGEVFETQRLLKSGVHEALVMTVAIPLLWGVPPEYERLEAGIKTGGGIIEKVTRQWVIY